MYITIIRFDTQLNSGNKQINKLTGDKKLQISQSGLKGSL